MKLQIARQALLVISLLILSNISARAQTNIDQNNLIQNPGFDSGGTGWSQNGGGAYFYNTTVGTETDSIFSFGWWSGASFWQNTTATIQPGIDYVLTIRALVSQSPLGGVNLSLQDVTQGWTILTNQTALFPDQSQTWRIFSLYISSNTIAANVGDTIGVGAAIYETNQNVYGWIWTDWMQLAPAIPLFLTQPVSMTNYAGAAATLSTKAVGAITSNTGPGSVLTYQWYDNNNPIPNATNSALTFAALSSTNSGTYYVVATGPYGMAQSSNAVLNVLPANPPIASQPPVSQTAYLNQTVQFTVGVAGTPPFTYQWTSNSVAIPGQTNATLTLSNLMANYAATYTVLITNQFGNTSASATLGVIVPQAGTYEAAAISLDPQVYLRFSDINYTTNAMTVNEGSLGASANGQLLGSYAATMGPIPAAYPNFESTNPAVQFDGASAQVAIPAQNLATNTGNTVTMTAWINTYGPQANYSGLVFERDSGASGLQIQVDTNGNNELSYDWANGSRWQFQSGLVIPSYQWCFVALVITPTNATIYLQDGTSMHTATDSFNEGLTSFSQATEVGWDPAGGTSGRFFNGIIDEVSIWSRSLSPTEIYALYSSATGTPAGIVTSPSGVTNYTGNPFQLSVVASGAPPLYYQWYHNGNPLAGATNVTYSVASAATSDSGTYYVAVHNSAGLTNSDMATVSIVTSAPQFVTTPQPVTVWSGVPTTLSASVQGSQPFYYQWFSNSVAISGQTNASLTIFDPEVSAGYNLQVMNSYGTTNSSVAVVTVQIESQAPQMLYNTNTTAVWTLRNNYQPIQGVWFQTGTKSRVVTHLAYFDSTGSGLMTNHWVGIYQGAPGSGSLVANVQIPAGTGPAYYQGFRWVALSAPLVLQANTNYVLAASDNNWDLWPDAYVPTWNPAYVGNNDGSTRYVLYDNSLFSWPHEPNTPITTWAVDHTYGAFNLGAFPFVMSHSGTGYQLNWTLGTLVSSTNAAGPYVPVPAAASPFALPMTGKSQFYRIQY